MTDEYKERLEMSEIKLCGKRKYRNMDNTKIGLKRGNSNRKNEMVS